MTYLKEPPFDFKMQCNLGFNPQYDVILSDLFRDDGGADTALEISPLEESAHE